jgi:Na+/H+-dicarboxylate symporter
MNLTIKIVLGLVLGAVVGRILNLFAPDLFTPLNTWVFTPLGQLFLNFIKMLVVPIVFFSITLGVAGLGDPKKLGRIGAKTIIFFLATTTIAIFIGLALAAVIQPGNVGSFDTSGAQFETSEFQQIQYQRWHKVKCFKLLHSLSSLVLH